MIQKIKQELAQGKTFLSFAVLRTLGQVLMFLVPLLIAKFLAPDEFGIYSLSIMIVYFFTALLINSSQKPFIVYANQELSERNKINKAFTIRLIILGGSVILFSLLSVLFINPLTQFASITKIQYLFLFAAYIGLGIRYSFESVFLALNKRITHALFGIATGLLSVLYVVLVYYFFALTLESIFAMFFAAPLIASFFFLPRLERKKILPLTIDWELFKKMFDYTKWTMIGGTAVYFISWGDNLVLRFFVSLEEIGFYNLGYQVFKGVIILLGVTKLYFLPFISQHINDSSKIKSYLYNKRPKIILLGLFGLAVLFLTIPYIFNAFYGETYKESIPVIQILLVASVFVLYRSFYAPLFDALKRYRFTELANISFVIINLGLDVVFVIYFGMVGAAIATAITYIFSSIVYEVYFRRYCRHIITQ